MLPVPLLLKELSESSLDSRVVSLFLQFPRGAIAREGTGILGDLRARCGPYKSFRQTPQNKQEEKLKYLRVLMSAWTSSERWSPTQV